MATRTPATDPGGAQTLREAFDRLCELPVDARPAWLEANVPDPERRERLRQLLKAHEGSGFLDVAAPDHAQRLAAPELVAEQLVGTRIGAFRLVRLLGQGGMSAVFLAEREGSDFTQQVALKLLRRGLYSELEQRLFQRERQVLATLDHPNIARLIDGGVTETGVPYLAMERVDGVPITTYAATHGLDLRARLAMFLALCGAVAEAHRNLVVHRDIKPANTLVTADGSVKLLDFGIAKLVGEEGSDVQATVGAFTPDYAAPEQREGGTITTATDVYGLGVLLHELLLGLRPQGTPTRRPSSRVNETGGAAGAALPPARLRRTLRGDLDNILLKALAEEPAHRYASAAALAADVEAWLQGRPVMAHPPSRLYRARKFVRRHRGGVALTALFAAGLLAAFGLTAWQAEVARREAQRADAVRDFLIELFDAAKADLPSNEKPGPEALVHEAIRRLQDDPAMEAGLRDELMLTLGTVAMYVGDYVQAEKLADRVLANGSLAPARRLEAVVLEAQIEQITDRNTAAHERLAAALPLLRATSSQVAVEGLMLQATTALHAGQGEESLALAREAAAKARQVWPADSLDEVKVAAFPGQVAIALRREREGIALLDPVLARWRALDLPRDRDFAQALMILADAREHTGDAAASEALHVEGIALLRRIYRRPHDRLATALEDYASFLTKRERFDEARGLLAEALEINRAVLGADSIEAADVLDSIGMLDGAMRDFAGSEEALRQSLAILDARVEAGGHEKTRMLVHSHLAQTLGNLGKLDEARAGAAVALAEARELYGPDSSYAAGVLYVQSRIALAGGDAQGALARSEEALAMLGRLEVASPHLFILNLRARALAREALGLPEPALADAEAALQRIREARPDARIQIASTLALRARLERALQREAAARASIGEARALAVPARFLAPEDAAVLAPSAD